MTIRRARFGITILVILGLPACRMQTAPKPDPHYVLGKPWQSGKVWHYPQERFDLNETGLASVLAQPHAVLTTNGEIFDQTSLAAAHPTLQLPAIARITNLGNGRSVVVRINDRGTGDPHRLLEVTQRTTTLLGMSEVARIRLQVLSAESHEAADALPGAPRLALTSAPRGVVEVAELPPPPGVRQVAGKAVIRMSSARAEDAPSTLPSRLPEIVSQAPAAPGRLLVRLDTFQEYRYAASQRARLISFRPAIVSVVENRVRRYRVDIGPLETVQQAENALDQALAAGIPDARIVVD